jgi:hypothetical protein
LPVVLIADAAQSQRASEPHRVVSRWMKRGKRTGRSRAGNQDARLMLLRGRFVLGILANLSSFLRAVASYF